MAKNTIIAIINRAESLDIIWKGAKEKRFTLLMDLENVDHEIPLDFEKLLNMDNFNFAHDIMGIQSNFNRQTKKMDNCFLPRCSKPNKED